MLLYQIYHYRAIISIGIGNIILIFLICFAATINAVINSKATPKLL